MSLANCSTRTNWWTIQDWLVTVQLQGPMRHTRLWTGDKEYVIVRSYHPLRRSRSCWNWSRLSGLVKMFARLTDPSTFRSWMLPPICSRNQWYFVDIVRDWGVRRGGSAPARLMQDSLSSKTVLMSEVSLCGRVKVCVNSAWILRRCSRVRIPVANATYSAFMVEVAVSDCNLLAQTMGLPPKVRTKPVRDRALVGSCGQPNLRGG